MRSRSSATPRRSTIPETRGPLETFLMRLRQLGATLDEIDAVAATWDQLDPDDDPDPDAWTVTRRREVMYADDTYLLALIREGRDEYELGTTTQEQADDKAEAAAFNAALNEASGRVGGTVPAVLAWVGGDPTRARAVLDLEAAPTGAGRKTLLGPLRELVDA